MPAPLYLRIAADFRRRIAAGSLPGGLRLPSSRALARQLGVSRNTILAAYQALACEGLLAARRGSGTRVAAPPAPRLNPRRLLRDAHYPSAAVPFHDPDGHRLTLQS